MHSLTACPFRDRLCPSLDTLVPFDSEKPYDIKDVIFNVSLLPGEIYIVFALFHEIRTHNVVK